MRRWGVASAREPLAAKVPEITLMFWVIKVLTTGMGEATSDALAHVNIFLAGLVGLTGFIVAMRWQLQSRTYRTGVYWFAVAMVAVFGTMWADGLHVVFKVPYAASSALSAIVLALIFRAWYRREGTLSIHSIVTRRREQFYWLTVLATFALGTAVGDLTATTLKLGFFKSILLFAVAISLPAIAWWRFGLNPVAAFWIAYVLTRPLGASIADWLGKPHSFAGGLGFGDGDVAGLATVLIVALVGYVAWRRNDIQKPVDEPQVAGQHRLLYHYTSRLALAAIVDAGELRPAPLQVDGVAASKVPDVIWLTDDAHPGRGDDHGLSPHGPGEADRREIRFTVSVDDALPWSAWTQVYRVPRKLRRRMDERGGGLSARWWVSTRPIHASTWVRIVDVASGRTIWPLDREPVDDAAVAEFS